MKRSQLFSILIAACMIAATAVILIRLRPSSPQDANETTEETLQGEATLVRLTPGKLAVAEIETQSVQRQTLVLTRTMPARFGYDETSHVAVRSPTNGVLQSVSVKPGDQVTAGMKLATLRSPEVGAARSLLLQRISELDLAATESDWQATVQNGVRQLADCIGKRQSMDEIKRQLSGSVLGSFRSELLGKYNTLVLAEQLSGSIEEIRRSGAISGKVAREREAKLQEALSSLEASVEQATFETTQKRRETAARTRVAQQAVVLARQQLLNLTGQPLADDWATSADVDEAMLAILEIRSPISGTVQQRGFTETERVEAGAELFVIADTSKLWVRADLRGRDLASVSVQADDPIDVSVSSQPDEILEGTVYFLGREIDALSGTVPLVAVIENQSERFRPGLFARVNVPVGQADDVIVVPDSAVIDLDGQPSVFVQQNGGFRPSPVETGERSENLIEIRSGISVGDQVVVAGTFTLKSELLLEGEE